MATTSGSSSKQSLPEDLEIPILLWLPVESLLRLKFVCKSWCSLIKNPNFIIQHYNHPRLSNPEENVLVVNNTEKDISLCSGSNNFHVFERFPLPHPVKRVISSYNGVICLEHGHNFSLYNPALHEIRILPEPPALEDMSKSNSYSFYGGFGFDYINNDYKVVRIVQDDAQSPKACTTIYSLNSNCRRTVDAALPVTLQLESKFGDPNGWRTPVCNGRYIWWMGECQNLHREIVSFDVCQEVFETIPLPDVMANRSGYQLNLAVLNDKIVCFCIMKVPMGWFEFNVWLLNQYGVAESWTELYTLSMEHFVKPISFLNNGEMICWGDNENTMSQIRKWQLYLRDHVTQELNILPDEMCPCIMPPRVGFYKESLLSIKASSTVCN